MDQGITINGNILYELPHDAFDYNACKDNGYQGLPYKKPLTDDKPHRNKGLTKETISRIITLYLVDKKSIATVAREAGCNKSTVTRHLKDNGIRLRPEKKFVTVDQANDMLRMHRDGMTYEEIAEAYDLKPVTVGRHVRNAKENNHD